MSCPYTGQEVWQNTHAVKCQIDSCSCANYDKPELVKLCPTYQKQQGEQA